MTALMGLTGAVFGAIVGYVLAFGAFVAVDAHVVHLSLDAGWAFAELGVAIGLVGGSVAAVRLRHLQQANERGRASALVGFVACALGGLAAGAFGVWAGVTVAWPEEAGNVLPLMALGAAAGCGSGCLLGAFSCARRKNKRGQRSMR